MTATTQTPLKHYIHMLLEPGEAGNRASRFVDKVLIVLILLNVLAVILETVPSIHDGIPHVFATIELVSVTIFGAEYLARVWTCKAHHKYSGPWGRLRYMVSPLALIDLISILPFFMGAFWGVDLRFLRLLRLLRILKLTRYSSALTMLLDVIREEADSFLAGIFILFVLLIIAASGAYLAEHQVQPDKFGSIPAAMWWAMATLTTVGYGDVTPITPMGRLFGSIIAVVGIGMAALPAGILASGMADRLRRTRETLKAQFRIALQDGVIDAAEEAQIERLRKHLGLSKAASLEILRELQSETTNCTCPNCGHHFERGGK
jgi:voltage-gated potassium channel